jgi:hypothetical protein
MHPVPPGPSLCSFVHYSSCNFLCKHKHAWAFLGLWTQMGLHCSVLPLIFPINISWTYFTLVTKRFASLSVWLQYYHSIALPQFI